MASTTTNTKPLAIVEYDADTTFKIEDQKYPVSPPYIYTPLPSKGDHLRLIQLSPGNFNASIHVKITNYSLDFTVDKPPYCAVSYTWNDSEYDRLIVAGKASPRVRPTENKLFSAASTLGRGQAHSHIDESARRASAVSRPKAAGNTVDRCTLYQPSRLR
jgi:hypothetical protein